MKTHVTIILALLYIQFGFHCKAQENKILDSSYTQYLVKLDNNPRFDEKEMSLKEFFVTGYKCPNEINSPETTRSIMVGFFVDESGKKSEIEILRSSFREANTQMKQLANEMPDWLPATVNGEAVKTYAKIIITFGDASTKYAITDVLHPEKFYPIQLSQGPQFENGFEGFLQYIDNNLQYPEDALKKKEKGKIDIGFTIDKEGKVKDCYVMDGENEAMSNEALRIIREMPDWTPAKRNGRNVEIFYSTIISFEVDKSRKIQIQPRPSDLNKRLADFQFKPVMINKYVNNKPSLDRLPHFIGGEEMMYKFIGGNLTYPLEAQKAKKIGRVVIGFVVEKDGSINEASVLNGFDWRCDEEALRVVKKMDGAWTPAMHNGKLLRLYFTLPIVFKLRDNSATNSNRHRSSKQSSRFGF